MTDQSKPDKMLVERLRREVTVGSGTVTPLRLQAADALTAANARADGAARDAALVAAAYEAAASIQTHHYNTWMDKCEHPLDTTSQDIIRALTPAHAAAALDRIKAEVRDAALVAASLKIASTNEINKTRMEKLVLSLRVQPPQAEPAPAVTVREVARDALMVEHIDIVADACRKFKLSEPNFRAALRAIAGGGDE